MGNTNRRVGLIDMLTTGTTGTEGIDLHILVEQFHPQYCRPARGRINTEQNEVWRLDAASNGEMRTKRWMPISGPQPAVGVIALDGKGDALHPGIIAGLIIGNLGFKPLDITKTQIHAQQHVGPVLGPRCHRHRR